MSDLIDVLKNSMTLERPRILSVGCGTLDCIVRIDEFPVKSSKVVASEGVLTPAGMATAAAIGVAKLGGCIDLWTVVGDDAGGDLFREKLKKFGVGVDTVISDSTRPTAVSAIVVDGSGERLACPYFGNEFLPSVTDRFSWAKIGKI